MSALMFLWLYARALVRGVQLRYGEVEQMPDYHTGASCSLFTLDECWVMYQTGRWKPWVIERGARAHGRFVIAMTPAEIAHEEAVMREWERLANAAHSVPPINEIFPENNASPR